MGTTVYSCCLFPWKNNQKIVPPQSVVANSSSLEKGGSRTKIRGVGSREKEVFEEENEGFNCGVLKRRTAIVKGVSLISSGVVLGVAEKGLAVVKQGLLAGRIPGLSEPDEQGWRTYRRPDEKSGGHGVGWSPIIPYLFSVPEGWEEVPVSIADLGGTEIDLRFGNAKEGRLSVIVAPVLRFADYLDDDAKIEKIGPPEKVITAFGPEVIGENVEGKVLSMDVTEDNGRKYYHFELEPPHVLITATAAGNRLYLFSVTGSGKSSYPILTSCV
ncbi:hypothetical protein LguiB_010051 [Lonicera macranthoides]